MDFHLEPEPDPAPPDPSGRRQRKAKALMEGAGVSPIEKGVAAYFRNLYRPGTLQFHAIVQASENPADRRIAFAGPMYDAEGGFPLTRIGMVTNGGGHELLNDGPFSDSDPKWSPQGDRLAFLSDRGEGSGNFQLYIADAADLSVQKPGPALAGEVVESFAWSADGGRILIQTAEAGADAAGSAATPAIGARDEQKASWMPRVETGSHDGSWRRARIWDLEGGAITDIGGLGQNVWEAVWCGLREVAAIVSRSPTEGRWYDTELAIASADGGPFIRYAKPGLELAQVTASPDGRFLAVAQGRFHRTVGLGTLTVYDRVEGRVIEPAPDVQVSAIGWHHDSRLFFVGMQPPETVAGTVDIASRRSEIIWRTSGTAGRKVPAGWPAAGESFLVPGHSFDRYAYLARVGEEGVEEIVLDLTHDGAREILSRMEPARAISWLGSDGLEIQGYLALPKDVFRPPLVTFVHGGPSHLFRDSWTFDNPLAAFLVSSGYAVLFPNPRGSSGRGLEFASSVIGDWGGEDSRDILAGIDHVLAHYDVDGSRLFVTGGSYGGYMTTWLVTQTDRFNAACAIAPLSDMRSFFFTAHHPEFLSLYTGAGPYEVGGLFDRRSPLRHADRVTTPTMLLAGERDKTTPSSQAIQFHRALVLADVPSELALYPEEGHAAARLEAQIDQAARMLRWFKRWEAWNTAEHTR